jgi:hypothetical protein
MAIDCRDEKTRVGQMLGAEVVKVASTIRTHIQRGERTMMGSLSKITVWPWEPVTGDSCTYLGAVEEVLPLRFIEMPSLEEAKVIRDECHDALDTARTSGARDWEINVNTRFADWSDKLVEAIETNRQTLDVSIQAIRINDIVLANSSTETLFETGLTIKARSPFPYTQVLGYSNGCVSYLPRAEDFPPGGWDIHKRWYGVPDLLFQAYSLPTAIHPDSEQQVIDRTLALLDQLNV